MKKVFISILVVILFVINNLNAQNYIIDLSTYWSETPNWISFATVPTAVCVGQTASFNIMLDGTYYWELVSNHPNPTFSTSGNSNVINFTTPPFIGQGNYQFTLTVFGSGCNRDTTLSVASLGAPSNLNLSASPGDQVCAGTEVTFTAGATNALPGSSTYSWFVNGSPITVADPTSNMITYTPLNGQTFSFEVSNGTCSSVLPQAVVMTVYDNPSPVIAFDDLNNLNHFCAGQTAIVNETSGITNLVSWEFTVAGASHVVTNPTYSWPVTMAQNGLQAHVVVIDNNGCQGTSAPLIITIDDLPDLSGTATPYPTCEGDPMRIHIPGFNLSGQHDLEVWNWNHTTQYNIINPIPVPSSGAFDIYVLLPTNTGMIHFWLRNRTTGCSNWNKP